MRVRFLILACAVALAASAAAPPGPAPAVAKAHAKKKKCKKHHKRIRGKCRKVKRKPAQVSRFGSMITGTTSAERLRRSHVLGTDVIRLTARLDGLPNGTVSSAISQGFSVAMHVGNTNLPSTPPSDLAAYQAQLGQALDLHRVPLIAIENEETASHFYTGTPQQYLAQLSAAIPVAHARGVKVSDGGLVSAGVTLATWHDLWTSGRRAEADAYAQQAFPGSRMGPEVIDYLPNSSDPGRPILQGQADAQEVLADTQTLLAGFRGLPLDYVNFHWYGSAPAALATTIDFLRRSSGHNVISTEMGQFDASPSYLTSSLDVAAARHLPWTIWFGADGDPAVGLFNPDGSLRANGAALRDFVARCDNRVNCGRDKPKKKGKKRKKKRKKKR